MTKKQLNFFASLKHRKFREESNLFTVEGEKIVNEVLALGHEIEVLFGTDAWSSSQANSSISVKEMHTVSEEEMARLSSFKSPSTVFAVLKIPEEKPWEPGSQPGLTIAVDGVQDPGNLGTIIRLADWFEVRTILCSPETVDSFNPKVLQASMGSFLRVRCVPTDLESLLPRHTDERTFPLCGTFLDGEDLFSTSLPNSGIIVFGNEGSGISAGIEKHIHRRLTIPRFSESAESLNVASAAAIVLAEFKRKSRIAG